jgi:hypothetical protein
MSIVDWLGILLCVVVWLPVHGGLWLIERRKVRVAWRLLQAYGVAATGLGLWIGLTLFSSHFNLLGSWRSLPVAAVPSAGLFLLTLAIMPGTPRPGVTGPEVLGKLLHFLVVVGLFEEVWFRGVWFACFGNSFLGSVVLGSAAFGLVHYVPGLEGRGLDSAFLSVFGGLCFAAARYNGAGILPLAVGHGLFDFLFHYAQVEKKTRLGGFATTAVFVLGCLLIVGATFMGSV